MSDTNRTTHPMTATWDAARASGKILGVGTKQALVLGRKLLERIAAGDEEAVAEGRRGLEGKRAERVKRKADEIVRVLGGSRERAERRRPERRKPRARKERPERELEPIRPDASRFAGLVVGEDPVLVERDALALTRAIVKIGSLSRAEAAWPRAVEILRGLAK